MGADADIDESVELMSADGPREVVTDKGVVYRARDERLRRVVALKVIAPAILADEGARARFHREALALSQLNHPNICTIFEIGEAGGQDFIAIASRMILA